MYKLLNFKNDLLEGFAPLFFMRIVGRFALEGRQSDAYEIVKRNCHKL